MTLKRNRNQTTNKNHAWSWILFQSFFSASLNRFEFRNLDHAEPSETLPPMVGVPTGCDHMVPWDQGPKAEPCHIVASAEDTVQDGWNEATECTSFSVCVCVCVCLVDVSLLCPSEVLRSSKSFWQHCRLGNMRHPRMAFGSTGHWGGGGGGSGGPPTQAWNMGTAESPVSDLSYVDARLE